MDFARKAQAATDFLITYGWTLLIIVIVIALIVFLAPNLGDESERCSFAAGSLECTSIYLSIEEDITTNTDALSIWDLKITNRMNKAIFVCQVVCSQGPLDYNLFDPLPGAGGPSVTPADGGNPTPTECMSPDDVMWRIDPGETAPVVVKAGPGGGSDYQARRFWWTVVRCLNRDGNEIAPSAGSIYRGKLYVLYSYADEGSYYTSTEVPQHVATADIVARVGRSVTVTATTTG